MMLKNRKILFVIGSLSKGGAEVQLLRLAKKLKEQGLWVELFVFEDIGSLRDEAILSVNKIHYGILSSTSSKFKKFLALSKAMLSIFVLCVKNNYDVVHSFLPLANLIASFSARIALIRNIVTSRRALNTHQDKSPVWKYLDKFSTLFSNKVVCNAIMVKKDTIAREGDSGKLFVVKNILDNLIFSPKRIARESIDISDSDFVFVIVANLIVYKGHDYLIKALGLLAIDFPSIKLIIVGEDRGIKANLVELSNTEGVADKIRWVGYCDNPADYLCISNVLVSSSLEEGLSNSIMEAMHYGLPVISTDVGGSTELLNNGDYGFLVPAACPIQLAKAMKYVILNYEAALTNSSQVKLVIKREFSSEKIVSDYLKIYELS